MVPFRSFRPLYLLRAMNAVRALEFRPMELGPMLVMFHVLMLPMLPVVLVVLVVFVLVLRVLVMMLVVILLVRVSVALHIAHFQAQLVRDLAPSHTARAQLQHAG